MSARRLMLVSVPVGGIVLTGCTSDAEPAPEAATRAPSETTVLPEQIWTVETLAETILEGEGPAPVEPIVSVSGTVNSLGGEWDVQVDVLSVTASPNGTELFYVLRSPDGAVAEADRFAWGDGSKIWNDTRSVAIYDEEADVWLQPYTSPYHRVTDPGDAFCVCSNMPSAVGEADYLSALLPPLSEGVDTVTIDFPGLELVEDVPVSRR